MWYLQWENEQGKIIHTELRLLDGSRRRELKEKAKKLAEETWQKIPSEKKSGIPTLVWKETFPINWETSEKK